MHSAVGDFHARQFPLRPGNALVLRLGCVGSVVAVACLSGVGAHDSAKVCAMGGILLGLAWPHLMCLDKKIWKE
jgi:hypothetical protein